ncbi:MAG TPA: hypothetical protein VE944_06805 [Nostoc sp.]|uniref:hypothetical protein n=1 Tax=Nostoc sp. TaxID=1180 RepID=UPI002D478F4A|nr:hypothetical protein [Nostoc sp.]HYX14066.1 hypothetical protein [Nostoc sp.]
MQVYLNIPTSTKEPVEAILLENLSKRQILDHLGDLLKRKYDFTLTIADTIKSGYAKEESRDLVTLNEYLDRENIVVSKGDFHLLAVRVAKAFVTAYGVKPRRVNRQSPNGDFKNKAYAYTEAQLHIIDEVLKTIPHVKNPRK